MSTDADATHYASKHMNTENIDKVLSSANPETQNQDTHDGLFPPIDAARRFNGD